MGQWSKRSIMEANTTLVPLRFVAEIIGAEVFWCSATRSVRIILGDEELTLAIGEMTPRIFA